jgi:ABC-type transport system involved in cytochrome c biogenesis permease component
MSIVIAAIYGLASLCLSMRMWIATGLTYGVCVFVVMTYVVVPLSAAPSRPAPGISNIIKDLLALLGWERCPGGLVDTRHNGNV